MLYPVYILIFLLDAWKLVLINFNIYTNFSATNISFFKLNNIL